MQLTKLAPAAALVATALAAFESDPKVFNYNSTCDSDAPKGPRVSTVVITLFTCGPY